MVTDNPILARDAVGPSTPTVQNRRFRHSCVSQNSAQTRTTISESGHLGGVGPAHGFQGSLYQRGDVGLSPSDGAKNLAAAVNRLDVADADLQVAFVVFAAAYEGRVQADRDRRRGDRRLLCCRIAEPLADL